MIPANRGSKLIQVQQKCIDAYNCFKCFVKCYMRLGTYFKLKIFFIDFNEEMGGYNLDDTTLEGKAQKNDVDLLRKYFLYY